MRAGAVLSPLDRRRDRRTSWRRLEGRGADVVAVCLLHSYVNPAHEARLAEALACRRLAGVGVARSPARVPRVRAVEHDGRQCVRRRRSSIGISARSSRARPAPAVDHAVERRLDLGRGGARAGRADGAVRTGRRASSARSAVARDGRLRPRHFVRHGRHVDRRQPDRRRHRDDDGVADRRLSRAAAGDRHPHRRRRRRIDRVRRRRRRAARRAREAPAPIRGRSATAAAPS